MYVYAFCQCKESKCGEEKEAREGTIRGYTLRSLRDSNVINLLDLHAGISGKQCERQEQEQAGDVLRASSVVVS